MRAPFRRPPAATTPPGPRDAAVVVVEVLDSVEGADAVGTGDGAARLGFGRQRGDTSVRWIDDERGVAEVARPLFVAERARSRVVEVTRLAALRGPPPEFLVGQGLAAPELGRPRRRDAAHVSLVQIRRRSGWLSELGRRPLPGWRRSGRRLGRLLACAPGGRAVPQCHHRHCACDRYRCITPARGSVLNASGAHPVWRGAVHRPIESRSPGLPGSRALKPRDSRGDARRTMFRESAEYWASAGEATQAPAASA